MFRTRHFAHVSLMTARANVGSLFEQDCQLQDVWLRTFTERIDEESADIVVIHMQETGGKHYVECAWQVPKLIDELASRMHMYPAVQTYLDLDHEAPDFTALGCVVLVKAGSIGLVSQFNFSSSVYVPVERGVNINLEGLESSPLIIKRKFPKHFWPTFKWSRKGYMQTRWKMNNIVVRCAVGTSRPFPVRVGVHQGSSLSPLLFILCMDTITKEIQKQHPWTLLFADDVMLASESRDDLQKQVQSWKDQLQQYGLRLNTSKTEYMECGPRIEDGSIRVDGTELNKVNCFKYLGSKVTSTGDIDQEGRARVNAAWMKWKMATGVLCDKKVPVRLKSKIYRTVVRPVALYGCECWPTTKALERVLHAMEMRMLRWTIGVTLKEKVSNDTVRSIFGVVPITEKMEARLRWFGHVLRREEDSVAKTALKPDVSGVRPRGRPKIRWLDRRRVKLDMIDARLCTADAMDRTKWKTRSRKADPATTRDKR
ncbi:hypothetical protein RB195_023714 [Necator americanus]|uniref:Reverse transcriptase domain-containing protein n=1 Tax=Necator americanus TaxID=51031 RepID=A0ABR1EKF8_NECAM